jgi:hypothetical protein
MPSAIYFWTWESFTALVSTPLRSGFESITASAEREGHRRSRDGATRQPADLVSGIVWGCRTRGYYFRVPHRVSLRSDAPIVNGDICHPSQRNKARMRVQCVRRCLVDTGPRLSIRSILSVPWSGDALPLASWWQTIEDGPLIGVVMTLFAVLSRYLWFFHAGACQDVHKDGFDSLRGFPK